MSKRFIDTELFHDEWFCDLSKDGKLFFIYYITNCDHAGVLRLNRKLCKFQSGIDNIEQTLTKDFTNSLVTVKQDLYFMPKFIKFQYPEFPKSHVKQQDGAIKILKSLNLWDEELNSYITVAKELSNSYDNVNGIDSLKKEGVTVKTKIEIAQDKLKEEMTQYVDKYTKDMLNDFYRYWAEANTKTGKCKYQMMDTWETSKRLITWNSRNLKETK